MDETNNATYHAKVVMKAVPKWIPISERLPKENGFYLTSTMYGEVYLDGWNGINWERTEEILAWMPLPEAYREEK